MQLVARERSIAPSDIDYVHTNIAVMTDGAPRRVVDAIVIYDTVYGGLRLTEDLFTRFVHYTTQLDRAAELAGAAALVGDEITEKFKEWAAGLTPTDVTASSAPMASDGMYMVYKPGSVVGVYIQGVLMSRELIAPRLIDLGDGEKQVAYLYNNNGRKTLVQHTEVQPIGEESNFVYWSPENNEFHELDEEGADVTKRAAGSNGWVLIYKPGSMVYVPRFGHMVKRSISLPKLTIDANGNNTVQYEYPDDGGVCVVLHDEIEASGADWSTIMWNPTTNQYKEVDRAIH